MDDLVDTGSTLDNAVRLLTSAGARKILAFATHGRFSAEGEQRVAEIPGLERLVICNTLPHRYRRKYKVLRWFSRRFLGGLLDKKDMLWLHIPLIQSP